MYSKYHTPDGQRVQIPENYSGCAFSERFRDPSASLAQPHRLDVAKPTPPEPRDPPPLQKKDVECNPPLQSPAEDTDSHTKASTKCAPPPPSPVAGISPVLLPSAELHHSPAFRGLFEKMGISFPFSHGIGFDELLILGLILLLSQNEADSDLILWLILLLFCG